MDCREQKIRKVQESTKQLRAVCETIKQAIKELPGEKIRELRLDWKKEVDEDGRIVFLPTMKLIMHVPRD